MTRKPATIAAAARPDRDPGFGGIAPPLWASDTFRWDDADTKPAYDYSRTVSPNRDLLVEALAELEGAAGGVVVNSGQAAALLALLMLPTGAHVVAPHDCYGGSYRLIKGFEDKGRITAAFVDMADDAAFGAALGDDPALVWFESPSNPLLRLTDIAARAVQAKAAGARTIADNTLLTPCRQRPLDLGCDLVLHSTTKAINGHCDLIGGALLAKDASLIEEMHWWSNAAGLNGSAHDAWQTLRGLRTLPIRIDHQEASAKRIVDHLSRRSKVAQVHYPGLGFMLSFRLVGDAGAFLERLQLVTLAASLGGFATLICKPSTMTHRGMPPEAQAAAGIHSDLLRLSVGLEDADDLIADLDRGFASLQG